MNKQLAVEILSMFEDGAEEISIRMNEDNEVIAARMAHTPATTGKRYRRKTQPI